MARPKSDKTAYTFRLSPDVGEWLREASNATGLSQAGVVERLVRDYIGALVEDVDRERQKARARFRKLPGVKGKKASVDLSREVQEGLEDLAGADVDMVEVNRAFRDILRAAVDQAREGRSSPEP